MVAEVGVESTGAFDWSEEVEVLAGARLREVSVSKYPASVVQSCLCTAA